MPDLKREHIELASQYWRDNQTLKAGRVIFENLPHEVRVTWATNILRAIVNRTKRVSPPIEHILQLGSNPSEWRKAHDAFRMTRRAALEYQDMPVLSAEQELLRSQLCVAELVAKVMYNATNPDDEFDEDSGWWIAVCLKDVLDTVGDERFSRSMWSLLCLEEGSEPPTSSQQPPAKPET